MHPNAASSPLTRTIRPTREMRAPLIKRGGATSAPDVLFNRKRNAAVSAIPSPLRTRSCKLRRSDRSGRTTASRRTSRRAAAAAAAAEDHHFHRPRGGSSPAGDVGRCNRDPRGSRRAPGKSSEVSWLSRLPAHASVIRTRISSSPAESGGREEGEEEEERETEQRVNYSRGWMQLMALPPGGR